MKTGKMILSIILSFLVMVVAQGVACLFGNMVVLMKMPIFIGNIVTGILHIICSRFLSAE